MPVTFDQVSALSDGAVSSAEMQEALDAAIVCMDELGVAATVEMLDENAGLTGGWTFEVSDQSVAVSQAVSTCTTATIGELEMPFLVGSRSESNAAMEATAECLEAAGELDSESLVGVLDGSGPVQDCLDRR